MLHTKFTENAQIAPLFRGGWPQAGGCPKGCVLLAFIPRLCYNTPGRCAMDYTLVRTNRKTIAIYIRPGGLVEVRAPRRCPQRDIERFVASKAKWIAEKRALMLARARRQAEPDPALEARLRAQAKETLPQRVAHFANRMGVSPARVKVTGAKTRWGSCSSQGNLNFSWRLMLADDRAIDYVVVHELAHLREMNHSPRFWAVVEAVLPDYKQRRLRLKQLQAAIVEQGL